MARALSGVILIDAARDELLEQQHVLLARVRAAQVWQGVPQLLHDDKKLFGLHALRPGLGGSPAQDIVQLIRVIAAPYGPIHHVAKGVQRLGLESRRRTPFEGHHGSEGETGCGGGMAADLAR